MPAYNQDEVIDQLNRYLKLKHRKIKLEYGYCHGFTLLWLYKMSEGQEQWYYNTIKKIVSHKNKDFDDIEIDIEKFLNHIEWLQSPSKYVPEIQQLDVDKILELPRDFTLSYVFNHREFTNALNEAIKKNKMVCLSGPGHTVGVFEKDNKYILFDPNDDDGVGKEFGSIQELQVEIVKSLFVNFKLQSKMLPVTINVTDTKEHKNEDALQTSKIGMFKQLTKSNKKANLIGSEGISPLYIACESGDEEGVKVLLSKGIDINHQIQDGSTALYIAAQNGYLTIVKMLLEHNADPNIVANDLISPLKAASEKGHNEVVKTLLNAGAHIDHIDKDNESSLNVAADENHFDVVRTLLEAGATISKTPGKVVVSLRHAIKNQNWNIAILILEHMDNITKLNSFDLKLLRKNKKPIKEAIDRRMNESNFSIKNPIIRNILDIGFKKPRADFIFPRTALRTSEQLCIHSRKRKIENLLEDDEQPLAKRYAANSAPRFLLITVGLPVLEASLKSVPNIRNYVIIMLRQKESKDQRNTK